MRTRLIVVALVALAALLALVAVNGLPAWQRQDSLRGDSATGRLGGEASLGLFTGAQNERKLTAAFLAAPGAKTKAALDGQRKATDRGIKRFRHLSGTSLQAGQRRRWEHVGRIYQHLDQLLVVRRAVDRHSGASDTAADYYTQLLTHLIEFYQALSAMDDGELALETRPLVGLFWASDALSQQDALLAAARPAGRMTSAQRTAFAQAYGSQQVMYTRWIAPYLPPSEKALYDRITGSRDWHTVLRVERAVLNAPGDASGASLEDLPGLREWDAAYGRVSQRLGLLNLQRTQGLLAHGFHRADEIRSQVLVLLGSSLAAVVAVGVLIVGLLRTVIRRSREASERAREVAEVRLPQMVRDLQHGRPVETAALPRPPAGARTEFDHIEGAIAQLAQQASDSALLVAAERRGFQRFAEGATARAAAVIHRLILPELDDLQRQFGDDQATLPKLYALDHQVARVRRQLDNVLLLSGGELDHPHQESVHIANIVHDAAGESAGLSRAVPELRAEVWITAQAASELTHLLAELVDNAAVYSPADFEITVRTLQVADGVVIEVEDRGQPLKAEVLDQLNSRLNQDPLLYGELGRAPQLGLFVVGRLAQRLGVTVALRQSPYGGVLAIVRVPWALHDHTPRQPAAPASAPPSRPPAAPTASGLVRRIPRPAPDRSAAAPDPPPAPPGPERASRSLAPLPERRPGRHMAPQPRDDTATADDPASGLAADPRPLDAIADDFSALDDLNHPRTDGDSR
ncbi:nitrate- and nitrite sensing domain-containing protein [Streptomyces sp. NPDC018045]|uniref:sensor histidine kinase n=1 Tax=Streptomyces sp. NPDC018045 TaxID=3365037 RepID=UPI0037B33ED7